MAGNAAYDTDFYAWTQEQARLLRQAGAMRVNLPLDFAYLAEEIEDMGNAIKDAIQSHLATVIEHLLKLEHSPDLYPRIKWRASVGKARRHLAQKLSRHPSLDYPATVLVPAWLDGRDDAIQDDSVDPGMLPADCPYTLEQVLDTDWWPINRHGADQASAR